MVTGGFLLLFFFFFPLLLFIDSFFALVDQRYFFYWFCYIFEIAILYWKPMRNFLLKINWFTSFKNFRISLNFLIGIFKDIFLLILLYFWNCHFILKTNTNFSIENQLLFASIIFLLKINTKISIELPVYFQLVILYWKSIQFFLLKINCFIYYSLLIGIFKDIFLLILLYFWNCHFI